jgi:dihydroneopterin aldolase
METAATARRLDRTAAKCHPRRLNGTGRYPLPDSLILEVADFEVDVLTGIYSEETGKPQPLLISVVAQLKPAEHYAADTPLSASKNYMDLKFAATDALPAGVHFKLIESVADHICETLFIQDKRVEAVTVKIVKLAIAEKGERIGITLTRERR